MEFPTPLVRGRLLRRYKRFFADVVLEDGTPVTAHCPNPGAMLGLNMPGLGVWLSRSDNPKRKLGFTLELVELEAATPRQFVTVGINTMLPNRLVAEALAADLIPELTGYAVHRREVKYGENSRVDFLLTDPDRPACWLEVKNCHMRRAGTLAEFPDCVAARSTKHLRELAGRVRAGERAVALFVIQRADCDAFSPCAELDPAFAAALDEVVDAGVEALCYACDMSTSGVSIARRVPLVRAVSPA